MGVAKIAAGWSHTVVLLGPVASLTALQCANELILTWPSNAVGFTLQKTLDLSPPVAWINWGGIPPIIGGHFTVTNSITSGRQFYRLIRP